MELKIQTLSIERFRALRQLKIEGLGRVNLITGKNNTGKSSVLEALRILASSASPAVIGEILRFREELSGDEEALGKISDGDGKFILSSLFHGFPPFSSKIDPILIMSGNQNNKMNLTIETGWAAEERLDDGTRRLNIQQESFSDDEESLIPVLAIKTDDRSRVFSNRRFLNRRSPTYYNDDSQRIPCVFVSPYGGEQTASLGLLWDNIALTDFEADVIKALQIIDPEIEAVTMVGGEVGRLPRVAKVRSKAIPRPIPLRSYGDGLNRLFGIILSLVNARNGLLLIDEFENGMHYSVQENAWRIIFRLAKSLDIQVMATSHSWDTIEAFQKAAAEDSEEGVLVRLTRKGENIIPTLFYEDELAVVTRDRIEVR